MTIKLLTDREVALAREVGEVRALGFILYTQLQQAERVLTRSDHATTRDMVTAALRLWEEYDATLHGGKKDDTH